jgi:hypothetical protein
VSDIALPVRVLPQPTETTCGPTCLHGVYAFHDDSVALDTVIDETRSLLDGGTLSVFLARHALERGYDATIYSYNVQLFDPTWERFDTGCVIDKLKQQAEQTNDSKLRTSSMAYIGFLEAGGQLRFDTLKEELLRTLLNRSGPILAGLSATFLYRTARENPRTNEFDDIGGEPSGHFVVIAGYRQRTRELLVCDPWQPNPLTEANRYWLDVDRVISSVLLGVVTYDANMLMIEPKGVTA